MPRAGRPAPSLDSVLPQRAEELAALFRLTDRLYRASGRDETFDAALDAITSVLGCDRASILLFDDAGVMRFVAWRGLSEAYRSAVDGHTPWKVGEPDPEPIFIEDIALTDEPDALKETIVGEGIRGLAFIPLVAQSHTIGKFMTYYEAPHAFTRAEADLAVHIARQLGFSLERARAEEARQKAEHALRESEGRFRLMSEHAPVMIWVSHPDGSCMHLNRALREFWEVDESALGTFDWRATIHPDDADAVAAEMHDALRQRRPVSVEARYRNAAGEYRRLTTHALPRLGADGTFLGMIGVNIDDTERHESEAQRELLLAELSHRVKNMLAVVQGMARQTFRNTDSLTAARETFDGRLMALATAHDLLTRTSWKSAPLSELVRDALPVRGDRSQISVSGPGVMLDARQTLGLTMALHELFTNAIKYGALSTEAGRVSLSWQVGATGRLILDWCETGGPAAVPPSREGFGTKLIRQVFCHDLGGELSIDYLPQGMTCRAEMPLRR